MKQYKITEFQTAKDGTEFIKEQTIIELTEEEHYETWEQLCDLCGVAFDRFEIEEI